uniref:(California timema) hypothetical protein n=1 Tax=Timema californicum TaxID=61474 RepID=A0A7R9PAX3_TIMCA|nr:unnamed protein product [Timema californicum]
MPYTLTVRAFDGKYNDTAKVEIKIANVNDNPPVFLKFNNNITIQEEMIVEGCIANLEAYDPDIQDRGAPQHIQFDVVKEDQKALLSIDEQGCLRLIKPLDRDPPNGSPVWQVLIAANDEDGGPSSLQSTAELIIILEDINDNAPILDMVQPVVWRENQPPGKITTLKAKDYDSEANGAPFKFRIDDSAGPEITNNFAIRNAPPLRTLLLCRAQLLFISGCVADEELEALVTFDREERKMYLLPIAITDSGIPPLTGTSTLTIVIGDENDNPMKPGQSNIFVYNYKGEAPDTEVGRVYVEDPDDWDLPDKYFVWKNGNHPNFDLNSNTGMITMLSHIPEGTYSLEFTVSTIRPAPGIVIYMTQVTEEAPLIPRHSVDAIVNITIKVIPEEAVDKSGSIRFAGITAPEFVAPGPNGSPSKHGAAPLASRLFTERQCGDCVQCYSPSKQELLRWRLASLLNVSVENVDVFTVLHSPHNTNGSQLDVRYSAHGSPYRQPEKLNNLLAAHQEEIEQELGLTILMVNIDECLMEKVFCETESCTNFLNKSNVPYAVYTNTSSFVGVRAVVDPLCNCKVKERPICLNGGTPVGPFNCECIDGFEGPYCELISIGFHGKGWALYPPLSACEEARVSLEVTPYTEDGLILYVGPLRYNPALHVQDFMSLELRSGFPRLLMDYGTGTVFVENKQIKLSDNKPHHIDVIWSKTSIELKVDNCQMSSCLALTTPQGPNEFLNTYNLGYPSDSKNVNPGCTMEMAKAVSFGIDSNFLVAILVCVAILLILLLAVVVHRRKTDDMFKDTDDIRENIINYEDEGGGEGDMTGYDLNVLRLMYDQDGLPIVDKPPLKENYHTRSAPEEVPDICGFLDAKKKVCDNDPETYPFDDVRHYAYEGDGNSTGSLSSLASGEILLWLRSSSGPVATKVSRVPTWCL